MTRDAAIMSMVSILIATFALVYMIFGKRKESYEKIQDRRIEDLERKEEICQGRVTELERQKDQLMLQLVGLLGRPQLRAPDTYEGPQGIQRQ